MPLIVCYVLQNEYDSDTRVKKCVMQLGYELIKKQT